LSNGHNKVCPRCGSIAAIDARTCRRCGRQFRTQFAGTSGTVVSRRAAHGESRDSTQRKKVAPTTSLLPSEFHRPAEEYPEFAAPEGMPPTYHELPNIEVLRRDLGESLSKFGTPNSEPFSQLFLADAPGSPLTYDPPVLPDLMPFPSTAGPQITGINPATRNLSGTGIDWTNPETFAGPAPVQYEAYARPATSSSTFAQVDSAPATPMAFGSTDFSLNMSPVVAPGIEVEIDERDYLTAGDLLPYDKALQPVNKWFRYGLAAVSTVCVLSITIGTFNYLHLKPAAFISQAIVTLSPVGKSSNVAEPLAKSGGIQTDQDGDFLKPLVVSSHRAIKGLDPSVFSQLKSGNSTVGVIDAAPDNVAVLSSTPEGPQQAPKDTGNLGLPAAPSSDDSQSPEAFSQTNFPLVQFKFHHHYRRAVL